MARMNANRKRGIAAWLPVLLIVLAAMLFVYFAANQDDIYNRAMQPDVFAAMEGDPAALQSERLMLEKGVYTVTVSYAAKGEATAQIINDLVADEFGNPSPVLASVPLDPAQTEAVLKLTLAQTTRGVRVVLLGDVTAGVTVVRSNGPVWRDTMFFMFCILLAGACILRFRYKRKDEILPEGLALIVCLLAGGVASLPVLRDFFVYGHDLAFHLTRVEAIKDGLLSGQFPVRIDPAFLNGYGYASSVMYGDLLLYIPALLRLGGVSMMVSWQAFIVLLNVVTAYLTYRAVKAWTGRAEIGLIAGAAYTLGMYRLMTLFTRAAAGEALAMLFYPMVIVGIAATVWQPKQGNPNMPPVKGMCWLIIGMTGMLQTHLISLQIAAIGCALFTVVCVILRKTTWKALGRLCIAAGITVLINLWFLVPLLRFSALDLDIFHQEKQMYLHAAYLPQLFASFVDPYAGMTTFPGTTVEMPLSVGLLLGAGLILFVFVKYRNRQAQPEDKMLYAAGRGTALFAVLALCMASVVFPWTYVHKIPVLGKVLFAAQFPWRYLGAASALLAIVFAISAYLLLHKSGNGRLLVLVCLLLSILNAAPFIDKAIQGDGQVLVMEDKTADYIGKVYLPGDYFMEGTDVDAYLRRAPVPAVVTGDAQISAYQKDYTNIAFDYTATTETTLELPLYGYPLYRATLDGEQALAIGTGKNHILTVTLPEGEGHVAVGYGKPWYFIFADWVSLGVLVGLMGWGIFWKRRKRNASL